MAREINQNIIELQEDIFQLRMPPPGSNVYLVRGSNKNALIDASTADNLPEIRRHLRAIGLRLRDIHLVILTHEHFDHIGAAMAFFQTSLIAAHTLAANKIELQDEFTTLQYTNTPARPLHIHIWLEDGITIDLGHYQLRTIYTPGHTSGCICIYEPGKRLLFSGDTVFGGGTVSDIRASGNASDYFNSLSRLSTIRVDHLYPAHGKISDTPAEDIEEARQRTQTLFEESKILFEALSQKVIRQRHQKKAGKK